MSNPSPDTIGPGWYDDPQDPDMYRYYDGIKWTKDRAPKYEDTQPKVSINEEESKPVQRVEPPLFGQRNRKYPLNVEEFKIFVNHHIEKQKGKWLGYYFLSVIGALVSFRQGHVEDKMWISVLCFILGLIVVFTIIPFMWFDIRQKRKGKEYSRAIEWTYISICIVILIVIAAILGGITTTEFPEHIQTEDNSSPIVPYMLSAIPAVVFPLRIFRFLVRDK